MMGRLPVGWAQCQLQDIVQPRKERVSPQDFPDMPFVGMDHIEPVTMRVIGCGRAGEMKSTCFRFHRLDVIYGRLRPYLNKVAVPGFDGLASAEFIVFPPSEAVIPHYLAYRLNAGDFVAFASRINEGDRPRVSFEQICSFPVEVPPLVEQRAIVAKIEALFSQLDKGIELLQTIKQQLKQYRQAILKAAFEGKLTAAWRAEQQATGRLPDAHELLEEIRGELDTKYQSQVCCPVQNESNSLGKLPEGWVWAHLGDVGDVTGGLTKNSKRAVLPRVVPYLRVANVYADQLDLQEVHHMGVMDGEYEKALLAKDDILFVEGNGSVDQIGRTAIWDGSISPCVHQNHLIRCRLVRREMAKFVLYWFLSPVGRSVVIRQASSTSGLHTLSISKVSSLVIPIASLAEQQKMVEEIETRLSILDDVDRIVDQGMERAQAIRQSILKKAFEGRLLSAPELAAARGDPEYEPADSLLERIAREAKTCTPPSGPSPRHRRAQYTRVIGPRGSAVESRSEAE